MITTVKLTSWSSLFRATLRFAIVSLVVLSCSLSHYFSRTQLNLSSEKDYVHL